MLDYRIIADPLTETVDAFHGSDLLARSQSAKMLYETRLNPAVYFPKSDIQVGLSGPTDLRTFCPFKGTASYFDVEIGGETHANGAWAYENASHEGRGVEGLVSFMPDLLTKLELGTNALREPDSGSITGPLVDWLMGEAWLCKTPEEFTAAIGNKLVDHGVSVMRISILIWSLHPQIAGKNLVWTRGEDEVLVRKPSYDIIDSPQFVNSPLRHVSNGLGGIRQPLNVDEPDFTFPIFDDLRKEGATDYVAMPLHFSDGQINVMTLACDHPDGFTTANLGLVFESSFVISRFFEAFTLKENARSLLETYLGKRTGARVLGGEIRRGDGDEIDAAILFCDLRNSTALEAELGRGAYLDLLNSFFDGAAGIIAEHEGEVLKFIGDAVLAIFPASKSENSCCQQALASAERIIEHFAGDEAPDIDCAIGIDYGAVTYGNVGSQDRLDFTVIGSAANVAARLADYGKGNGHPIVASAPVMGSVADKMALGKLDLHNVAEPVEAFCPQPAGS